MNGANSNRPTAHSRLRPRFKVLAVLAGIPFGFDCDAANRAVIATCDVSFRPVVTVGADAGVHGPSEWSTVVRSQGLYFVAPTYDPGTVSVFDSNGRLLRIIGARGSGPGEQTEVSAVAVIGDTLYIADDSEGRLSRYTVNGEYLGTAAVGYLLFTARRGGGLALIQKSTKGGLTLVDVMSGDSSVHQFSIANESTERDEQPGSVVRDHRGAALWIGYWGQYLFEQYAYDGTRLSRIVGDVPWFPPASVVRADPDKFDVIGGLLDFEIDYEGRVLALFGRGSKREYRQRAHEESESAVVEGAVGPSDVRVGEIVFHILDPRSGRVIAERIGSEPWLKGFADATHVFSRSTTADGYPVLSIFEVIALDTRTKEAC